jgi:hypothetical protein
LHIVGLLERQTTHGRVGPEQLAALRVQLQHRGTVGRHGSRVGAHQVAHRVQGQAAPAPAGVGLPGGVVLGRSQAARQERGGGHGGVARGFGQPLRQRQRRALLV